MKQVIGQRSKLPKQCKVCKVEFTPKQYASCKTKCDECIKLAQKDKKFKQLKKQIEKPLKPRKVIKQKIDKEQARVNALVRKRDKGKSCISCGATGVYLQAGHYIAVGQCQSLRYNLDNIHGQCVKCNCMNAGTQEMEEAFRRGLIPRVGLARILEMEEEKKHAGRYSLNE